MLADTQPPKGTSVLAYAPLYPYPKPEKWNFIVADPVTNTVYTRAETALVEAEAAGLTQCTAQRAKQPLLLTGGEGGRQRWFLNPHREVSSAFAVKICWERAHLLGSESHPRVARAVAEP